MSTYKFLKALKLSSINKLKLLETRSYCSASDKKDVVVPTSEVQRFIEDIILKLDEKSPPKHAKELGQVLVAADYRGHFSHGLNRLDLYVKDVSSGMCDPKIHPTIIKESPATALVDGNNGLGPVVGNFCMKLAIQKAKDVGVGLVAAKGSNHYGIAGWYSMQAMNQNLIGLSFTNSSPFLSPTRSKNAALGTNPISVAASGLKENNEFVLDMATSAVAVGKIELQRRKGEAIPSGWAQNKKGEITTDANEAMEASCLMPLGGPEISSGYKGYGLALMVELFTGILSGGAFGPKIRKWMTATTTANLGQCFIAIDPSFFSPNFSSGLDEMIDFLRQMDPADKTKKVLVPGDPEKEHMRKIDKQGGIIYHSNQIEASKEMAKRFGVREMKEL